jgi:hypothetical protein
MEARKQKRSSIYMQDLQPLELIAAKILMIRGQRIMIDADLASLYGVPTKRLNEQVKRNPARFPKDFMFQLTTEEKQEVVANCDHLSALKFSRTLPFAFTEHGAVQAANVLNSPQAVEVGLYVVRAFIRLRELAITNKELVQRLNELERRVEHGFDTQDQTISDIMSALRQLMATPEPNKRPIGFIHPKEDK